ncbi:hypothetical protein VN12_14520 [Pirellula sp. SH-Sr6A]|uniref:DUF4350 domain-containing protein n=1 Tax=Pirellula sp. SH-Sr6A TaxID=1632865 RepID=UPI00078BFA70|nr:DUF4350 domain-containing protein [Pirellula sp. SH-Sr6A]AMV33338.1 hypothetical protein VN12_14520 [Pirellula sp. SH-Sr6A]
MGAGPFLPRGFFAIGIFVLGAFLAGAPSRGQSTPSIDTNDPAWSFRYELLQILLQQKGLDAEPKLSSTLANPTSHSLLILGDTSALTDRFWESCDSYVASGGRLLIAVDSLRNSSLAQIDRGPALTENPADRLRGFGDCILLRNLAVRHPLTESLTSIATNRTGWIVRRSNRYSWQNLMTLPENIRPSAAERKPVGIVGTLERNLNSERSDAPESVLPAGDIVILSDPSILSNGMLWYEDNGAFAAKLADWLSEDNRSAFTMMVSQETQEQFPIEALLPPEPPDDMVPPTPPMPRMETLLAVANRALADSAQPDRINRRLRDQPRGYSPERYARWVWQALGWLLAAGILWMLLRRAPYFRPMPPTKLPRTARQMLLQSQPLEIQNKIAAESLAREFSREWSGSETLAEWRRCLDEIKDLPHESLSHEDRIHIESILATAVFGGRTTTSDGDLENLSFWIRDLLERHRPRQKLASPNLAPS